MSVLKYYNTNTAQWELALVGPAGTPGATGPQGDIGATGPQGDPGSSIIGWTVDAFNSLVPNTDNLQDIGTPANRVRHLYVGPGSITVGDSVISESTTGKLVVPGLTRATTLFADEVEDTGDQTYVFATAPVVIDAALYNALLNSLDTSHFADFSVTLDGDGYIDSIQINGTGAYSQAEADVAKGSMYAYVGTDPDRSPFVAQDWMQIPFRLRTKADDVEYEFSTGGGSITVGTIDSEDNLNNDTGGITTIAFDETSGFSITELDGNIMKVSVSGASGPTDTIVSPNTYYSVTVADDGVVTMTTARGGLEFGALPEPGGPTHFHIMRPAGEGSDLFFGDDYNYVRQRPAQYGDDPAYGVEIGTNSMEGGDTSVWRFETWGDLTAPGGITASGTIAGNGVTINNNDELRFDTNGSSITEQRPGEGYDFFATDTVAVTGNGSGAKLNISYSAGDTAYQVNVNDGGTYSYLVGDQLKVTGDALGGVTPDNDLLVTVSQLYPGDNGNPWAVFAVTIDSGTPPAYEDGLHVRVNGTEWTFGNDYTLKMPGGIKFGDGTIQTTAATGGSGGIGDLTIGENNETILSANGDTFLNFNGFDGKLVIGSNADKNLLVSLYENNGGGATEWEFKTDGKLQLPAGGDIVDSNGTSVLGGSGGGVTGLLGTNGDPDSGGDNPSYTLEIDTDHPNNSIYLRTYQGNNPASPSIQLGRMEATSRGDNAIAIGNDDVGYQQGEGSIAIGHQAGWGDVSGIGLDSIAIGARAAYGYAANNSIVLNATGYDLNADNSGLYIKPVREDSASVSKTVFYNTATGEITYTDSVAAGAPDRLVSGDYSLVLNTDATIEFPNNTIKTTTSTSITIVGSTAPFAWYNIFGEINNSTSTQTTINGSVVYDTEGNVYVLGSTTDFDAPNFEGTNLFLKYSPQGELLWRKTWTDPTGNQCGSYNASMRFVPLAGTATIDAIVWASNGGGATPETGYIGTMDLEGNLVDLQGQSRAPLALPYYRITDIMPVEYSGFDGAYVTGSWYDIDNTGYSYPAITGVDFNDTSNYVNFKFNPSDQQPNFPGAHFKSINGAPGGLWATGAYATTLHNGSTYKPIVCMFGFTGPSAILYTIGDNYSDYNMWAEDSGSDDAGNGYVIVNVFNYNFSTHLNINSYTVIGSTSFIDAIPDLDRWQKKINRVGVDDGTYTTHGLGLVNYGDYVYVSVYLWDNISYSGDIALLKINAATGALEWARTIGSPSSEGNWSAGEGGYQSSSDITVDPTGTYISFTVVTGDNAQQGQYGNNFTIQYPLDGALLGTYGDFTISDSTADFVVTDHDFIVTDITTSTEINYGTINITTATLTASATTVGTGWTNFLQPLGDVVTGTQDQTWTFGQDGVLSLPGDIIVGAGSDEGQGHIYIDNNLNGATSIRWVNADQDDSTMLRVYMDSREELTNEQLEVGYNTTNGFYISTTQNTDGLWNNPDDDHSWYFGKDAGLVFPDATTQYTAWQGAAVISETAPADPLGRLWFNSTDSRLYIKYNNQWVDASPAVIPPASTYTGELEITETKISNIDYTGAKDVEIENASSVWKFAGDGELTVAGNIKFPDNTVQTTAWTGAAPLEIDGGDASSWA